MSENTATATPNEELERQIMSSLVAKNEREWWASREIERLRLSLSAAQADLSQACSLLSVAKCPCCDGSGANQISDDDWEQCQWCDEYQKLTLKTRALTTGQEGLGNPVDCIAELKRSTALLILMADSIIGTPLERLSQPIANRLEANRAAIANCRGGWEKS
jgi:hypothetical protein